MLSAPIRSLTDFYLSPSAAMGSSLPIMVTKRAGQIECKRVVKWSAVFQLVFQPKTKVDISFINQYLTEQIEITPVKQSTHLPHLHSPEK